ncbi:MAG: hypothetical protein B7Y45_09090 [Sphingomonas sp. 28-66-16]|nr:MAG: hypothetical protein B7Y45_09090 [Sphingomonas sp. 28-66-16]
MSVAAASMAVAPAMAASANPASGLSVAPAVKSLRASASSKKKSNIAQAGVIAIVVIAAGGAIAGIVAGTSGSSSR